MDSSHPSSPASTSSSTASVRARKRSSFGSLFSKKEKNGENGNGNGNRKERERERKPSATEKLLRNISGSMRNKDRRSSQTTFLVDQHQNS